MESILFAFGTRVLAIQQQPDNENQGVSELEEVLELSVHIAKMTLHVMKQIVSTRSTGSVCCCVMLQHSMRTNKAAVYQAVASQLVKGGQTLQNLVHVHAMYAWLLTVTAKCANLSIAVSSKFVESLAAVSLLLQ